MGQFVVLFCLSWSYLRVHCPACVGFLQGIYILALMFSGRLFDRSA